MTNDGKCCVWTGGENHTEATHSQRKWREKAYWGRIRAAWREIRIKTFGKKRQVLVRRDIIPKTECTILKRNVNTDDPSVVVTFHRIAPKWPIPRGDEGRLLWEREPKRNKNKLFERKDSYSSNDMEWNARDCRSNSFKMLKYSIDSHLPSLGFSLQWLLPNLALSPTNSLYYFPGTLDTLKSFEGTI